MTLCNPRYCSPAGSSVHGILQSKILKRVATPFSMWSSQPRGWSRVSNIATDSLPSEPSGKPKKGRGIRDQIANIHWIKEKAREFQKNIYFCFVDYAKSFDCVDHNKLWKILKEKGIPDQPSVSWETCRQVKKQQLGPDVEKWTGLKLEKEYVKAVYCHPAYLITMQGTSCKMQGWMNREV